MNPIEAPDAGPHEHERRTHSSALIDAATLCFICKRRGDDVSAAAAACALGRNPRCGSTVTDASPALLLAVAVPSSHRRRRRGEREDPFATKSGYMQFFLRHRDGGVGPVQQPLSSADPPGSDAESVSRTLELR